MSTAQGLPVFITLSRLRTASAAPPAPALVAKWIVGIELSSILLYSVSSVDPITIAYGMFMRS